MLKLWDTESGRELGTLPFLGSLLCIATYPWPRPVCADSAGGVHLIDLEGIEYGGPVIVTELERIAAIVDRLNG